MEVAFRHVGLDYQTYIVLDPQLFRPAEINVLHGDSRKARKTLGWEHRIDFEHLVQEMVDADLKYFAR